MDHLRSTGLPNDAHMGARLKMRASPQSRTSMCTFLSVIVLSCLTWSQNPRGTLRGVVQDPSAGRVPAANITVQAVGSSLNRETRNDADGEISLHEFLPCLYHVPVTATPLSDA